MTCSISIEQDVKKPLLIAWQYELQTESGSCCNADVVGRRYYDGQFEPSLPSPRASQRQPLTGSMLHGRSAGDLLRPTYLPGTTDYHTEPVMFGYERTMDDRPVWFHDDIVHGFLC